MRLVGLVAVSIAYLTTFGPAGAQPQPDDQQRAEQAMQRGIDASSRGDYEAALAAFREAAQLAPDANAPHKFAGETLEALDRWIEAIAEYRHYVEINPDAKGVAEIRRRIERIESMRIGVIEIRCSPLETAIELDGKQLGPMPGAVTVLAPSTISIAMSATGYVTKRDTIDVRPGEHVRFECVLARPEVVVATPPALPIRTVTKPWYRRWSVIGPAIAVAVAAIGTGMYFAFAGGAPSSDGGSHTFP